MSTAHTSQARWIAGQSVLYGNGYDLWSPATQHILTSCVWIMRVRARNELRNSKS